MYIAMDTGELSSSIPLKLLLMKFSRRVWARKPTEEGWRRQEIKREPSP